MSWVDQTLADFGRGLGIEQFEFNSNGVATIAGDDLGTLFLERADDAVLVYLVQEYPRLDAEHLSRALDACHWRRNVPWPVNAGLRHDRHLAFSVRLGESQFDLPTLERVITLVRELHREVKEGVAA